MRIAVAQMHGSSLEDWQQTLTILDEQIRAAGRQGAELLVLPECAWPAYHLGGADAYWDARRHGLPGSSFLLSRLAEAARRERLAICAGFVEEVGDRLWNAAALFESDGHLAGLHRKCFLWDFDHDWFQPGPAIEPIQTRFGPLGIMICADARLPEIPATLVRRGARLILHPTAWVNAGTWEVPWNPQPDFLIPARAAEFGVPIASASKWGLEGPTSFVGSSLICDSLGMKLVQATHSGTGVLVANVELGHPHLMVVSDQDRSLLLAASSPTRPAADVPDVAVAFVTDASLGPEQGVGTGGVEPVALPRIWITDRPGRPDGQVNVAGDTLMLTGLTDELVEFCGAYVASLPAQHVRTFHRARCLALRGAHVIVVWGEDVSDECVRARACENRVFVAWVRRDGMTVYDPTGRSLRATPLRPGEQAVLKLCQAADKCVAGRTDVFAGRTPSLYAL